MTAELGTDSWAEHSRGSVGESASKRGAWVALKSRLSGVERSVRRHPAMAFHMDRLRRRLSIICGMTMKAILLQVAGAG